MRHKKKYFILAFVIFGLTSKMSSQPYFHYLNHSSVWEMRSGGSDGITNYVSHFQYYINGDTSIGNYSYFKLYRSGVDSIIPIDSGSPSATLVNYYVGALREDYAKKFYFIFQNQSTEEILFDFNLYTGAYLQNNQGNYGCNNPQLMVQSYDTVYLGAIPLKRFKMNNITVQNIIEGVGSGGGLIEGGSMCLGYESNSVLICYKTDYARLTVNSNYPCTLPDTGSNCQAAYSYTSTYSSTSDAFVCSFTNLSSADDSITNVYWDFNDGGPYSTLYNPNHWYATPGNYNVCLHIQTSNGCQSYTCDTVAAISPTGINELKIDNEELIIYPNPNNGNFTLEFSERKNYLIELTNSLGACVYRETINSKKNTIHAGLGNGVYILKVTDVGNNKTVHRKIIIAK